MAQRQEVEKAQRMKEALGHAELSNLALQGLEIREDILVREHHAPRLAGGTGSKDNLDRIARAQILRRVGLVRKSGERFANGFKDEGRDSDIHLPKRMRAKEDFGRDFAGHSPREFGRPEAV